jgi:hypothetical protein
MLHPLLQIHPHIQKSLRCLIQSPGFESIAMHAACDAAAAGRCCAAGALEGLVA